MDALFTPTFILQLIIAIVAAGSAGVGIYLAIRLDLVRIMNVAENAMSIATAAASDTHVSR